MEIKGEVSLVDGKIVPIENQMIPSEGENSTEILINFALETASGQISLEACKQWFQKNIVSFQ